MGEDRKEHVSIVYTFSKEKLEEFKDMSVSQRLQWEESPFTPYGNVFSGKNDILMGENAFFC